MNLSTLIPSDLVSICATTLIVIFSICFILNIIKRYFTASHNILFMQTKFIKNESTKLVSQTNPILDELTENLTSGKATYAVKSFRHGILQVTLEDQEKFYVNKYSAQDFFNEETLGEDLFGHKPLTPSLLTGIGVLGTFLGLLLGLSTIDLNSMTNMSANGNFDTIISQLNYVIGGAKTAFSTSVYGIFFSLLCSIFFTICTNSIKIKIKKLNNHINDIYEPNVEIENDPRFGTDNLSIQTCIENMQNAIVSAINESSQTSSDTIASAITKHIQEINDNTAKVISNTLDKLNDSLNKNIKEQAEQSRLAGEEFVKNTRRAADIVEEKFDNIGKSLTEIMNDFDKNSKIANEEYKAATIELTSKIKDSFVNANESISTTLNLLISQLRGATGNMNKWQELVTSVVYNGNEIKNIIINLNKELLDAKGIIIDAQKLNTKVDKVLQNNINAYSKEIKGITTSLNEQWEKTVSNTMSAFLANMKTYNPDNE